MYKIYTEDMKNFVKIPCLNTCTQSLPLCIDIYTLKYKI